MIKKLTAGILAFVCLLPLGVTALAVSPPVLSGDSVGKANAIPYDYVIFDPDKSNVYRNDVYFETSHAGIIDDIGNYYVLENTGVLADKDCFSQKKITTTINANMAKDIKRVEKTEENGARYSLRLSDNAVLDKVMIGFDIKYMAIGDQKINVVKAGSNSTVKMNVKAGATIKLSHKLTIDYDKLTDLHFKAKYSESTENLLMKMNPVGVDGALLEPRTDGDCDISWEDAGQIAAEADLSNSENTTLRKLSTKWPDGKLIKKFTGGKSFIRSFTGTEGDFVTLRITNPFITGEREETIPHKEVVIYELKNDKLTNITKKFKYAENNDEEGSFEIEVSAPSTYIFSDHTV